MICRLKLWEKIECISEPKVNCFLWKVLKEILQLFIFSDWCNSQVQTAVLSNLILIWLFFSFLMKSLVEILALPEKSAFTICASASYYIRGCNIPKASCRFECQEKLSCESMLTQQITFPFKLGKEKHWILGKIVLLLWIIFLFVCFP